MPVAFIAAMLSAFVYAVVSGTPDPRGTELVFFGGGQLVVATLLLVFSVAWLLRDYDVHGHAVWNSALLMVLVAAVGLYYMHVSIGDAHDARNTCMASSEQILQAIVVGLLPLLAIAYRVSIRVRRKPGPSFLRSVKSVQVTMYLAMAIVLVYSIGAGAFVQGDRHDEVPTWLLTALLAMLSLFSAALIALLPFRDSRERMPERIQGDTATALDSTASRA